MTVLTDVKQKVQDLLPDQIGTGLRWTDSFVNTVARAADYAACDRCECAWHTQEIGLVADTLEYALDPDLISVVSVEFSSDGTNYDNYLRPATFKEFDELSMSWRDDRGSTPQWYALLGCPGLPETTTDAGDAASIVIYRSLSSVDSEKIKVGGFAIDPNGLHGVDDFIMDEAHVNYVMAILLATANPQKAMELYGKFLKGCEKSRERSL